MLWFLIGFGSGMLVVHAWPIVWPIIATKLKAILKVSVVLLALGLALGAAGAAHAATANLTWTEDFTIPVTGFDIERKAESCANGVLQFTPLAHTTTVATTYADTTIQYGYNYCYRVNAWNSAGKSGFSNTAGINVPLPLPAAPSQLDVILKP